MCAQRTVQAVAAVRGRAGQLQAEVWRGRRGRSGLGGLPAVRTPSCPHLAGSALPNSARCCSQQQPAFNFRPGVPHTKRTPGPSPTTHAPSALHTHLLILNFSPLRLRCTLPQVQGIAR